MSVILQPFQMLPFSPNIEFQFRLRADCLNDICDVPIIPKGKFVPFAIISDSEEIGEITLLCWDAPFEFTRTETFSKYCVEGSASIEFSKTYYSTISPLDAKKIAYEDANYYTEGQAYVEANVECETFYALNSEGDFFLNSENDKFILS